MKKLMVMVAALMLVATSAMTAAAADWNFYGNARIGTFVVDKETITDANNSLTTDTTSLDHKLATTSRIGAVAKVNDELTAGFEVGMNSGAFKNKGATVLDNDDVSVSNQDSVYLRHIWGEWNFGAGSLLVGRNWAPVNYFYSNQVYANDNGLIGQGSVFTGRVDMIRLKFGGFEIAAIEPKGPDALEWAADEPNYVIEYTLPQLQANYNMVMDYFSFNVGGGWNKFDIEAKPGTAGGGTDITSYIVSAGAQVKFGSAYLAGTFFTAENGAVFGMGNFFEENNNDTILDTESMGWTVVAGYTLNDMFAFEAGYGYQEAEELNAADVMVDNESVSYYVQSTITLTPGFFIVPEIGMVDDVEAGGNETLYYGLKWQINF